MSPIFGNAAHWLDLKEYPYEVELMILQVVIDNSEKFNVAIFGNIWSVFCLGKDALGMKFHLVFRVFE